VLIDGGLSGGVLDADPATPHAVKAAAQVLVEAACPAEAAHHHLDHALPS
jgi:hypothetical protein